MLDLINDAKPTRARLGKVWFRVCAFSWMGVAVGGAPVRVVFVVGREGAFFFFLSFSGGN